MAEDEESLSNANNTILVDEQKQHPFTESSATSPSPVVTGDTVLPLSEVVPSLEGYRGAGSEVALMMMTMSNDAVESCMPSGADDDETMAVPNISTVGAGKDFDADGVVGTGSDMPIRSGLKTEVKMENGEAVTEADISKFEGIKELEDHRAPNTGNDMPITADAGTETSTRNEYTGIHERVIEADISNVGVRKDLKEDGATDMGSLMPIGADAETEISTRNDYREIHETVVGSNISIVEVRKDLEEDGAMDMGSLMPIGADAEPEILTRNDYTETRETVTGANISIVEDRKELEEHGTTLTGSGKPTGADAEVEILNIIDNTKSVKMVNEANVSPVDNREELEERRAVGRGSDVPTGADTKTEIATRNDNIENDDTETETNVSTIEDSVGLGKDGEIEAAKHDEVQVPPIVLGDSVGGVTLEKEDEAMVAKSETANDETVQQVDISARIESEKDVEMDTVVHEEVEPFPADEEDEGMSVEDEAANETAEKEETEIDLAESGKASGGKRKRKNTKSSGGKSKSAGRASSKRKTIGEDVCFICFDGGDLVLCDRRGCTKAYHPSCIDRDEEFFRAKGSWNCGWHQCTICQKNAHYMCYTCTFSLCKGCLKDDDILCVRGNKGFCKSCMRLVKLIEGIGQENKDGPIDFDDKSSFEYLFKDYLMDLKSKLSLSSDEIADAKSPRKGSDVSAIKQGLGEAQFDKNDDGGSGSDASIETLEASKTKRRKLRKRSKSLRKEEETSGMAVNAREGFSTARTTEWASKELLEFVKHMKSGDASILSQFDVQAMLLEYIKTNNLRDPRRKSQIICDSRLESLFGKPRVGHFEMLKLLESHFLMKEDSQTDDVQGSVVDTEVDQFEVDANADTPTRGFRDRKRKRKKGENRGPQSNLDEYAAIDAHNISLIYLRRKLVEDLLEENNTFRDKIVGAFVRIRISGNVQKQDLYRLVQVVGTSKAKPYKFGKGTTDTVLDVLNLNKTEALSIATISNQDFTEEECKRLRQSIRCGLINRPTVGDILEKAMELQTARVNDWLESEILRVSHLRDRASETGRKKELRECVEKLQLLKTPDERHRRLEEVPEVHADPKMDPSYESEDEDRESNDGRQDVYLRSRDSSFSQRALGPVSPKDSLGHVGKTSPKSWELDRSSSGKNILSGSQDGGMYSLNEDAWSGGRDRDRESEAKNLEKLTSAANADPVWRNSQFLSRTESFSGVPSPATLQGKVAETSVKIDEGEKMWHYKDPSGKIQGPFSIVQLRKWSNSGYFPPDLRIWRSTDKQEESILLTDALAGRFEKVPSAVDSILSTAVRNGDSSGAAALCMIKDESLNLPSPTPKQDTAGWVEGHGPSVTVANVYPGIQTSASGGHSVGGGSGSNYLISVPTSEQIAALYTLQNAQSFAGSEQHSTAMNSQAVAHDTAAQHVQNPNVEVQQNASVVAPGQPQGYGNWGTAAPSVAGTFANAGADYWRAPAQGSQQNIQPTSVPWGVGMQENISSAGWGMMPGNPNAVGWGGQVPAMMNMNWGATMPPGTTNPSWVPNSGWVGNPGVQGLAPGNANPGWVAPTVNVGPTIQGPTSGNGWAIGTGAAIQGPPQGDPNQGSGASRGTRNNDQNQSGRFSDYNTSNWNRQSSFGSRGGLSRGSGLIDRSKPCPYLASGRCIKGSRCRYSHTT